MNDMKITLPETRTVPFGELEVGDFFICDNDLFRKIEGVFVADDIIERDIKGQHEYGVVFNAMLFDEYDGGGFMPFARDKEVIPVKVEIKVSYK